MTKKKGESKAEKAMVDAKASKVGGEESTNADKENTSISTKAEKDAKVRPKDNAVAVGSDTCLEVDKESTSLAKYQTLAKVRPKDHPVASRSETCSEVNKTITSLSK